MTKPDSRRVPDEGRFVVVNPTDADRLSVAGIPVVPDEIVEPGKVLLIDLDELWEGLDDAEFPG